MEMADTIVAKSDQLNADDLLGRTLTITVTKVLIPGGEQPVTIHYAGDNGKPYKPGKSMRRVLVHVWGPDASAYVGRSMTLYRDDEVVFGGLKVGGIRISHMSHTDKAQTMALTATRGNKKAYTIKPLRAGRAQEAAQEAPRQPEDRQTAREPEFEPAQQQQQPQRRTLGQYLDEKLAACREADDVVALEQGDQTIRNALSGPSADKVRELLERRYYALLPPPPDAPADPLDAPLAA